MTKVNIIIPYKLQGNGEELQLALRSIDANCKFDHRIILVGDCPQWIDKEKIIHLNPFIPKYTENSNAWNVIEKYKFALNHIFEFFPEDDDVLISYDDIIFLNPIEKKTLEMRVANAKLPDSYDFKTDASEAWKRVFVNTMNALKRNKLPELDFETHLPRLLSAKKMAEMFQHFGFKKRPYCVFTLYFNWVESKKKTIILSNVPDQTIKAGIYKAGDFDKYSEILNQYTFLNWSASFWSQELEQKIISLFPEPSQCEKRGSDV
jgi:hypothetical protein